MQAAHGTPRQRHAPSLASPKPVSPPSSPGAPPPLVRVAPTPGLQRPRTGWTTPPDPARAPDLERGTRVFEQCFGRDRSLIGRASRLKQQACKPPAIAQPPGSRVPAPHELPPALQPIDVMALLEAYEEVVPKACLADPERTLSALEELVTARVQPQELRELVARGRTRDVWRALVCAELTYAASFGAAGATGLSLVETPLIDPATQAPASAGLVQGLNVSSAFMLTSAVIGVGGEAAQAVIREGKMGPRYNAAVTYADGKRTPFAESATGQSVQRRSAAPFGLFYAADHLARTWIPSPPAVRLALGAGAAAVSALYRLGAVTRGGGVLDPTWLDGSNPDKRKAMQDAIADLRRGPWEASVGYCTDHVVPGLQAGAAQVMSAKGAVRSLGRLVAASVARAGSVLMAATGTADNLYARLASEFWLGASFGTASTWPQRLLDQAALERAQEGGGPVMVRPASPEVVAGLVPPKALT